jgi:LysM repeat protein
MLLVAIAVPGWTEPVLAMPSHQSPAPAGDPVIVAAGDVSNCSNQEKFLTGYLVDGIDGTVLVLGDGNNAGGLLAEYRDCYDPAWGRAKARTRPVPGNHDYAQGNASGYFTYFGDAATPLEPGCTRDCKGYYSYDLGTWHIVALNSEIPAEAGSAQEQWLRADLAAHPAVCTLAYWHKPRFSSQYPGINGGVDLYKALYEYGADVVLTGHAHGYERFGLQDPTGQADPGRGIRQFVVATGGAPLRDFKFIQPGSEARDAETYGVLKMTLRPAGYDWEFIPIPGKTFTDSGSGECVVAPNLPAPPAGVELATTDAAAVQPVAFVPDPGAEATASALALPAAGLDYVVQSGDTLSLIAGRYGLDWVAVAAANGITQVDVIEIGQTIRLPGVEESAPITGATATASALLPATSGTTTGAAAGATTGTVAATASITAAVLPQNIATAAGYYTVKEGDTLFGVALRLGLTREELAAANDLGTEDLLLIGQRLIIPTPTTPRAALLPTPTPTAGRFYTVASGDTIFGIALANGVDWQELLKLNGLEEDSLIQIGQRLQLPEE